MFFFADVLEFFLLFLLFTLKADYTGEWFGNKGRASED